MEAAAAKPFVYTRLNGGREIRLITLQQGDRDDPISVIIERVSLDQKPAYEALSYVWGPQTPSHLVRCNDASLTVGENLRDTLQHLRKPDGSRIGIMD
jgi:hypothetical protein